MTLLAENPYAIFIGGLILVAAFTAYWLFSGERWGLYATLAAVSLTAILLVIESLIVTDFESVEHTLRQIIADVDSRDAQRILRHAHSTADDIRDDVRSAMDRYNIDGITLWKRSLKVEVDRQQRPARAVARFNVSILGQQGEMKGRVPVSCVVQFWSEDGDWKVYDYEYHVGIGGRKW